MRFGSRATRVVATWAAAVPTKRRVARNVARSSPANHSVEGSRVNFKITTAEDLVLSELVLAGAVADLDMLQV